MKMTLREIVARVGQGKAAPLLGVSRPYLNQVCNGKKPIQSSLLYAALKKWPELLDVRGSLLESFESLHEGD